MRDPKFEVVRNVAIYRIILFGILLFEWNTFLPSVPANRLSDSFFLYDQFELFYDLWPKITDERAPDKIRLLLYVGNFFGAMALIGGVGKLSFGISASVTVALYFYRFLIYAYMFTNHSYLFGLLAFLMIFSGGGCLSTKREPTPSQLQKCEWTAINVRIQYAVVYFFASLWKIHPDWLNGAICKGIFLSFEEQGVARGVPWKILYNAMPHIFAFVALGGFILDTGMFLALTFRRPSPRTATLFTVLSCLFHLSVAFTMSQRIGYSFPICCLSGTLVFRPIGSERIQYTNKKSDKNVGRIDNRVETNLVGWVLRYLNGRKARATTNQRRFTLFWLLIQLAIPLRMPFVSQGKFAFNAKGYRFSWTMMLHTRNTIITHVGPGLTPKGKRYKKTLLLELFYMTPLCKRTVITRQKYMKDSANAKQDPRTLPLHHMLDARQHATLMAFPRFSHRIAGGMSDLFYDTHPMGCQGQRLVVYATHFAKLNDQGAFHRIFDPSIDMAAVNRKRKHRTYQQKLWDVLLDRAPGNSPDYILASGIGSGNYRLAKYVPELERMLPKKEHYEILIDRAPCLKARPLALWTGGYPLGIMPIDLPSNSSIYINGYQRKNDTEATVENQWKGLQKPERIDLSSGRQSTAMFELIEIGMDDPKITGTCGDTFLEDVFIALVFLA